MQTVKISKEGYKYAFETNACEKCAGNCCIGESGYIWVTPVQMQNIANFLNLEIEKFYEKYIKKVKYKYSLKEIEYNGGFKCVFFEEKRRSCGIYPVRPEQCKTFPFWEHFKTNINEVEDECPGIIRL
ncbi:MAG: YkgJ family cysteine cluster protein [Epsilonproteobacteria bacterium]|nr:YkgJ family cysteine cluster protein [Campylobacterota bacterium]